MREYSFIGKRVPRVDAWEKVRGEANFGADIKLPGTLFGKIKRSPHPFARILSIDTSKARRLPGVKAVITARDIVQFPYGSSIPDELPLSNEYVRYIGDDVAAVAATDEDIAEDALELIEVKYEVLEPVFNVEKAMVPGAPTIHPELEGVKQNIAYHIDYVRGDGDAAFKQADAIFEKRFTTQPAHPVYMEPQTYISHWDASGKLTVWAPNQGPFRLRLRLSQALGIPEHRIRIIQTYVGGGFGGKGGLVHSIGPVSALLSKKTGKPVMMVLTRTEEFTVGRPRHNEIIDLRMGFKKDGTYIAKEAVITAETGAYLGYGVLILITSATRPDGLYRNQNIKLVANMVYTNSIPHGSQRGVGNPQITFAMESMMDIAAEGLGIDPMELRLKNASQTGDTTIHGWHLNSCGLSDSIKRSAEQSGWRDKRGKTGTNRGIGMACQVHVSGNRSMHPLYDGSAAIVHVDQYGKVRLISGEGEIGQGATTIFAQIVAEELGVPLEDIDVLPVDTDISPYCLGALASRVTTVAGNAVLMAAVDARKQLLGYAAAMLGANADDMELNNGDIYVKEQPEKKATFAEVANYAVFKRGGTPVTGNSTYVVPDSVVMADRKTKYGNVSIGYPFGTQVAEVSVDPDTGKVDILHVWAATDSGKIINPMAAEGQIQGGVSHGMGYALSENYFFQEGRVLNTSFTDYKVPTALDIPKVHPIFIETDNPGSPYGAKGIGEPAMNPTAPAIVNAIYNAVGVRITDLPATPEKILKALRKKAK